MADLRIKQDDVVSVLNYNAPPDRPGHYIGKVISIVLEGGIEVNDHLCQFGGEHSPSKIKIKIKPYFKFKQNQYLWDTSLPEPIGDDLIFFERVLDLHIITEEAYEENRKKYLSKLNILTNLLYGRDEFRIERLVEKPKKFNIHGT